VYECLVFYLHVFRRCNARLLQLALLFDECNVLSVLCKLLHLRAFVWSYTGFAVLFFWLYLSPVYCKRSFISARLFCKLKVFFEPVKITRYSDCFSVS